MGFSEGGKVNRMPVLKEDEQVKYFKFGTLVREIICKISTRSCLVIIR